MQLISRAADAAAARYQSVPPSVLYPQLFLAVGWLRAAVAHGLSGSWWSGDEIMEFLDDTEQLRLPLYEPFVDALVRPVPLLTAGVVILLQLIVGLALVTNIRPVMWASVGIGLNVNFIMAGQVNPSVFYVAMALAVILGILWDRLEAGKAHRTAIQATVVAVVFLALFAPFTTTLDPANVIEDPSLILILLSSLFAASCWLMFYERERTEAAQTRLAEGGVALDENRRSQRPPPPVPQGSRTVGPRRVRDGTLPARTSIETDLQELRAASPVEIMEAMDRPVPRLTSHSTMSYHEDVDSGFSIREAETGEPDQSIMSRLGQNANQSRGIANFNVTAGVEPLTWYSVRCHFQVDERHYEERITVWQAVGFDEAIDLAEKEAEAYAQRMGGKYLGSCDCFHLPDPTIRAVQGAEIYSLVRASHLDSNTYLRTFFFTGAERSAEV